MNCNPSFSGMGASSSRRRTCSGSCPPQLRPSAGFWIALPDSPFKKRVSSFSLSDYVMQITDLNPRQSLRFSHGVLTECFGDGMLLVGLYRSAQGGRSRLLVGNDNIFRVCGREAVAWGVNHVR